MFIPKISLNNTQNQTTFGQKRFPRRGRELRRFENKFKRHPELAEKARELTTQSGGMSSRRLSEKMGSLYLQLARKKDVKVEPPYGAKVAAELVDERI